MVFLKIQFFNKISVPYWEFRCVRKHIFPRGSVLRAMHSLPRTPDPVSCELCRRSLQTQSSLCSNPRYCWHSCWKEAHWACFILCLQSRTSLSPAKSQVCHGQLDCYFAWAEMRKNTSSLGVFCFGLGFFSSVSWDAETFLVQLEDTQLKTQVCVYYKVHLGTPRSQKCGLPFSSTPELGHRQLRLCTAASCTQFIPVPPERRTIPAAPHPDLGGTLVSHPGQLSSQSPLCESWCEISRQKRVKSFTFFIPLHVHN